MPESSEVPGPEDEALDRFAELWWDDGRAAADHAPGPSQPGSPVVIRAERAW